MYHGYTILHGSRLIEPDERFRRITLASRLCSDLKIMWEMGASPTHIYESISALRCQACREEEFFDGEALMYSVLLRDLIEIINQGYDFQDFIDQLELRVNSLGDNDNHNLKESLIEHDNDNI